MILKKKDIIITFTLRSVVDQELRDTLVLSKKIEKTPSVKEKCYAFPLFKMASSIFKE